MEITCVKCGHVHPNATGDEAETCPKCGVVYAKARPTAARPAVEAPMPRAVFTVAAGAEYIDHLRAESHYPAFRSVVGLFTIVGYAVAALLLIGTLIVAAKGAGLGALMGGLVLSVVVFVLTKAAREASLMLADMTDATLRMAHRQER